MRIELTDTDCFETGGVDLRIDDGEVQHFESHEALVQWFETNPAFETERSRWRSVTKRWPSKAAGQSVDQPTVAIDRALLVE